MLANSPTGWPHVSVERLIEIYGSKASLTTTFSPLRSHKFILTDDGDYQSLDVEAITKPLADAGFGRKLSDLSTFMWRDRHVKPISDVTRRKSLTANMVSLRYVFDDNSDRDEIQPSDILTLTLDRITMTSGGEHTLLQCSVKVPIRAPTIG